MKVGLSSAVQTFKPTQEVGSYKDTRNRALEVMHESADSCSRYSTIYSGLSRDRLQNMRDASSTEEGQKKFEGKMLMVLTALLGGAGIVSAAINPAGANAQLLQTVKGVTETASKALQPVTTATDTLCKGHQEPTQTKKSVAQSGTQEAHTIEGEMDQRVRTMQSNAQQVAQTSEIKV
jgi:hypothetical protein